MQFLPLSPVPLPPAPRWRAWLGRIAGRAALG
jgi:hypothetical protein